MAFDVEAVRVRMPNRAIHWYSTIDSTMFAAARLAEGGAPSGTTVGADEQTAGHGRHGRAWHSEPDAGLYVSVVLRFPFAPDALPLVTLALGLAALDAIQCTAAVSCDLRWPNDVLIRERKCAGILPQLDHGAVIAGFGVNVNHAAFPAEIAQVATSLRIESGQIQSRESLLLELLSAIDAHCRLLAERGRGPILDMFSQASSYVRGRRVIVDLDGETLVGTTAGMNEFGFLLLRSDDGRMHTLLNGGVRPCS